MLKRIGVDQLILGMYIKEFCGSWMEHPFWRTSFVLTEAADIAAIQASSIKEVWIDCSKGLDVPAGSAVASVAESDTQVELQLKQANEGRRAVSPVSAEQELERAAKICLQSTRAVKSMFAEARMGNAVDVGGARLLVEEISDSVSRNPGAIISLARLKKADEYTYMHSVAVCAMMVALSKQMQLDSVQTHSAGLAGLLHDLGKALVPMDVLNKPGSLTDLEFRVIKGHPAKGHELLMTGEKIDEVALDVCLHHHEKVNGSGYPKGLKGEQISQFAKMGSVCDVYDAITSNRPYKEGWDPAESIRKMAEWSAGHFDQRIFQAFVKSIGIYPVGSLVQLSSGRIGVVTEQAGKSLTTPKVKVFFSTKSNMRIMPTEVDLSAQGCKERIINREDPDKWKFKDLNELWSGTVIA